MTTNLHDLGCKRTALVVCNTTGVGSSFVHGSTEFGTSICLSRGICARILAAVRFFHFSTTTDQSAAQKHKQQLNPVFFAHLRNATFDRKPCKSFKLDIELAEARPRKGALFPIPPPS